DGHARGFDAIAENPNIAGGPFSLWNRQGIRLAGTTRGLVSRNSVLPALRSIAAERQSNFVNPGLVEYSLGWDADLTVRLQATANVNVLRFKETQTVSAAIGRPLGSRSIGVDTSVGVQYRPLLS